VEYARHQAQLNERQKDGSSARDHLEAAAAKGSRRAQKELDGPEYPDALDYLYGWAMELVGRSGVGMEGLSPLTYTTLADWARLTGREPEPFEIEALLYLDAVIRHTETREKKEEPPAQREQAAWPARRVDGRS